MALKSWKQIVTDIANAFRSLTGSTANIRVGELAEKVGRLLLVKFAEGEQFIGVTYLKMEPNNQFNITNIEELESAPKEEWSFTGHTESVHAITVDASGYVYSGGYDDIVRKISPGGSQVWSFTDKFYIVREIALDTSGNIYIASNNRTVQKINSNGEQVWSFTAHTDWTLAVKLDATGNIYSGSQDKTVRKINSSGVQVWSFAGHTGGVNGIGLDAAGNVYSGSQDKTVRKIGKKLKRATVYFD